MLVWRFCTVIPLRTTSWGSCGSASAIWFCTSTAARTGVRATAKQTDRVMTPSLEVDDLQDAVTEAGVAGREPLRDQPRRAVPRRRGHAPRCRLVARVEHVCECPTEPLLHRALRHEDRAGVRKPEQPHAYELAGEQQVLRVRELGAELLSARRRLEGGGGGGQGGRPGVDAAVRPGRR